MIKQEDEQVSVQKHRTGHLFVTLILTLGCLSLSRVGLGQDLGSVPMAEAIEKALSPYLTHPKRRVPQEQIIVSEGRGEIWRYESFESGDVEAKLCDSARSLLFGRLPSNEGIKLLFGAQGQLRDLTLIHFRDQTTVQPDLNGQYVQSHKRLVLARMSMMREGVNYINEEEAKQRLVGPRCIDEAKRLLSDLWISESILERREALKVASIELSAKKQSAASGRQTSLLPPTQQPKVDLPARP